MATIEFGPHALRARQRHLGIQADAFNRGSLYLEGTELDENGLQHEADARRRAGFEVTFLGRRIMKKRFGITRRAGLLSYDQLAVDPRRLAGGFLRAALSRRTQIVAPVEVTELATTEGGRHRSDQTGAVNPCTSCRLCQRL